MVFRLTALLLIAWLGAACASKGTTPNTPRPRPFPGADLPPVAAQPAEPSEPAPPAPVVPRPAPAGVKGILTTAMDLRGTPYRNGGSEPGGGFDCSGFVQWVFAQNGTKLPREVKDQFKVGQLLDRDEVRPGDLVFFQTVSRGPSHVGIALGNGQFVHAPSSNGVVRVEKFTSGYWEARWVGARRVG